MKIALINGSPKQRNSASAFLLKELSEKLAGCVCTEIALHTKGAVTDAAMSELLEADALALAFPLYVDGMSYLNSYQKGVIFYQKHKIFYTTNQNARTFRKKIFCPPCVFCSVRAFVIRHSRKLAASRLRQSLGGGN